MSQADVHLATGRRILERIGEDVHHHLVEVLAVYPYGQLVAVVLIDQTDVLRLGLVSEEFVQVAHKRHEVGFAHVHGHQSLVNLPEVHHLVDEVEYSLSVSLDDFVDAVAGRVGVFLHERQQRRNDERHRRADLVADVHEEAQLGLAHLLGMYVFLQTQAVLLLAATVANKGVNTSGDGQQVEQIGPC